MCGIFCSVLGSTCTSAEHIHALEACVSNLKRRGPDHFQLVTHNSITGHRINLAASVLQTQGKKLCLQPFEENGNLLCWNGDVFSGSLTKEIYESELSDTEIISNHFSKCIEQQSSPIAILKEIIGPYSFVFCCKQKSTIWFGRDPIGRHSLLIGFPENASGLILSSVAHCSLSYLKELPAVGLYEVDLSSTKCSAGFSIRVHPWNEMEDSFVKECFVDFPVPIELESPICHQLFLSSAIPYPLEPLESELDSLLNIPKVLPIKEKMSMVYKLDSFYSNATKVLPLLEEAVKVRVKTSVSLCKDCIPSKNLMSSLKEESSCSHSKVAVLFSGGLDSAILARLVDKYLPENDSIDLLNVAFEKKVSHNKNSKKTGMSKTGQSVSPSLESSENYDQVFNVPDRQSGRETYRELQNLCPKRTWNFVEINVSLAELGEKRSECISHLIHPLKTVLDDSLGCALWFAGRGKGKILGCDESYTSPARIVIVGMGADEQFGGYRRHRSTFKNHGWQELSHELQVELKRIGSRNLGRDDRVLSHHGRQPRMPFLDERVIDFVKSLAPWKRCFPTDQFPCGIGDKLLLRLVAWHIGLRGASVLPKRALQFGSRIANSKENAADTTGRLLRLE